MVVLKNVRLEKASNQILWAMLSMDAMLHRRFSLELTVTSCGDGKHGANSYHCTDPVDAFDARIKDYDEDASGISKLDVEIAQKVCDRLKLELGPQFDVVLESDHIHVEFDRRRAKSVK